MQSSPTTYETGNEEQFGGYNYSADQIRGFGMTRLSGTGCRGNYDGFDFTHDNETTEPGYYAVDLDAGVNVELTATDANGLDITDRITHSVQAGASAKRMSLPETGTYTISYAITDDYGTEATASSQVTVIAGDPGGGGDADGNSSDDDLASTGGEGLFLGIMFAALLILAGVWSLSHKRVM